MSKTSSIRTAQFLTLKYHSRAMKPTYVEFREENIKLQTLDWELGVLDLKQVELDVYASFHAVVHLSSCK